MDQYGPRILFLFFFIPRGTRSITRDSYDSYLTRNDDYAVARSFVLLPCIPPSVHGRGEGQSENAGVPIDYVSVQARLLRGSKGVSYLRLCNFSFLGAVARETDTRRPAASIAAPRALPCLPLFLSFPPFIFFIVPFALLFIFFNRFVK